MYKACRDLIGGEYARSVPEDRQIVAIQQPVRFDFTRGRRTGELLRAIARAVLGQAKRRSVVGVGPTRAILVENNRQTEMTDLGAIKILISRRRWLFRTDYLRARFGSVKAKG